MKRFIKVLSVVSLSSMYLMQVPCTSMGDPALDTLGANGVSILPNFPSPTALLSGLPLIGGLF